MDSGKKETREQKNLPFVSIIIPVYNGANYLNEAIDSALSQTYENIEILVVNDGSTDNTENIALSYGDRIRYFKKENGGVSSALNLGIREMKGEYFSWLSHDDKYTPDKIKNQVELLNICDGKAIALCATQQIDKNSKEIITKRKNPFTSGEIVSWQKGLRKLILNGSFNGCALLIPKIALEENGLFDESLRYSQDRLMWIKILLNKYKLVYSDKKDALLRVHDKQLTQTGRSCFHHDSVIIGDLLLEDLAQNSSKEYNFLYYFAVCNAKYGNPAVVKKYIEKGKEKRLIGFYKIVKLKLIAVYGKIRPLIRKIYYKLFKKVKTC